MRNFAERYGPWAVVTGPTAGIGEAMARQLAAQGVNLILVARREELLARLAAELEEECGVETRCVVLDLARPDFLPELQAISDELDVGLLVSNAGFANTGEFLHNDLDDELRLLHVNCRAPLILAHAYGHRLVERGRGGMIFLASTASFIPNPLWANYAASKSYNLFLGNALSEELRDAGIDVLSLCPGGTKTSFHIEANLDMDDLSPFAEAVLSDPSDVAAAGLSQLGNRSTHIPGLQNRLAILSSRFLPRRWCSVAAGRMVGSILKKESAGSAP